jgi:hypothetical protein
LYIIEDFGLETLKGIIDGFIANFSLLSRVDHCGYVVHLLIMVTATVLINAFDAVVAVFVAVPSLDVRRSAPC